MVGDASLYSWTMLLLACIASSVVHCESNLKPKRLSLEDLENDNLRSELSSAVKKPVTGEVLQAQETHHQYAKPEPTHHHHHHQQYHREIFNTGDEDGQQISNPEDEPSNQIATGSDTGYTNGHAYKPTKYTHESQEELESHPSNEDYDDKYQEANSALSSPSPHQYHPGAASVGLEEPESYQQPQPQITVDSAQTPRVPSPGVSSNYIIVPMSRVLGYGGYHQNVLGDYNRQQHQPQQHQQQILLPIFLPAHSQPQAQSQQLYSSKLSYESPGSEHHHQRPAHYAHIYQHHHLQPSSSYKAAALGHQRATMGYATLRAKPQFRPAAQYQELSSYSLVAPGHAHHQSSGSDSEFYSGISNDNRRPDYNAHHQSSALPSYHQHQEQEELVEESLVGAQGHRLPSGGGGSGAEHQLYVPMLLAHKIMSQLLLKHTRGPIGNSIDYEAGAKQQHTSHQEVVHPEHDYASPATLSSYSRDQPSLLDSYVPSHVIAARNPHRYRERPIRLESGFLPSKINFVRAPAPTSSPASLILAGHQHHHQHPQEHEASDRRRSHH